MCLESSVGFLELAAEKPRSGDSKAIDSVFEKRSRMKQQLMELGYGGWRRLLRSIRELIGPVYSVLESVGWCMRDGTSEQLRDASESGSRIAQCVCEVFL